MGWRFYNNWRPYVPVAVRRRQAAKKIAKMKKAGRKISPIEIAGRKIATTFWGGAWCKNLEAYSDYSNRLPRGRTYVRNGSLIDLQIEVGRVRALVNGSELYDVDIEIKPLVRKRWTDIKGQCADQIDSLIELLRGSISKGVMEIVTRTGKGLFPSPREISLSCSCPDWATMCKHVAATLYGVGARLDHEPELLFTLRGVDPAEMVEAAVDQPQATRKSRRGRVLKTNELSSVFGVEIDMNEAFSEDVSTPARRARRAAQTRRRATSRTNKKKTRTKSAARTSAARRSAGKAAAGKITTRKTTKRKAATKTAASRKKTSTVKPTAKKKATSRTVSRRKTKTTTKKPAAKKTTRRTAATRKAASRKRTSTVKPTAKRKATSRTVSRRKTKTTPRRAAR